MSKKELLIHEIEEAPESLLDEVIDFFEYLVEKKRKEKQALTVASESSLKKDWLSPEEDEAWRDL